MDFGIILVVLCGFLVIVFALATMLALFGFRFAKSNLFGIFTGIVGGQKEDTDLITMPTPRGTKTNFRQKSQEYDFDSALQKYQGGTGANDTFSAQSKPNTASLSSGQPPQQGATPSPFAGRQTPPAQPPQQGTTPSPFANRSSRPSFGSASANTPPNEEGGLRGRDSLRKRNDDFNIYDDDMDFG